MPEGRIDRRAVGAGRAPVLAVVVTVVAVVLALAEPGGALEPRPDCDRRPLAAECRPTPGPTGGPAGSGGPVSGDGAAGGVQGGAGAARDGTTVPPSTDGEVVAATSADGDDEAGDGVGALFVGTAALAGFGAGVAAGVALLAATRRRNGPSSAPVAGAPLPSTPVGPVGTGPGPPEGAEASAVAPRDRLIQALIDVRDQVGSDAVRSGIAAALAEVGVAEVTVPAGLAFDPVRHKGVDRLSTADPALDRTVAGTERPGYLDRGAAVRLPEVVVYRLEPSEAPS